MITPESKGWSEAYCEQCGARADLSAASHDGRGGWRTTPLRTCPDCGLLTCRDCWHARSTRCERCFGQRQGVAALAGAPEPVTSLVPPPTAEPEAMPEPQPDPQRPLVTEPVAAGNAPVPTPGSGSGPLPAPRRRASLRARRPARWPAAVAAMAALVVAAVAAAVLLPDQSRRAGGVAAITARPSGPAPVQPGRSVGPSAAGQPPVVSPVPRPTAATPARVELVDAVVTSWVDDLGEVRAHVVATVENRGGAAAGLPGAESAFTILDRTGAEVAGGLFGHAFPPVVQPGERAYLIETLSATFADPDEIVDVEVDVQFEPTRDAIESLQVVNLAWDAGADGLVVSGDVRNTGAREIHSATIAVILLDRGSRVLGAVYDLTDVAGLEPGERVRFRTAYPGLPPIEHADVAEPVVVAFQQP